MDHLNEKSFDDHFQKYKHHDKVANEHMAKSVEAHEKGDKEKADFHAEHERRHREIARDHFDSALGRKKGATGPGVFAEMKDGPQGPALSREQLADILHKLEVIIDRKTDKQDGQPETQQPGKLYKPGENEEVEEDEDEHLHPKVQQESVIVLEGSGTGGSNPYGNFHSALRLAHKTGKPLRLHLDSDHLDIDPETAHEILTKKPKHVLNSIKNEDDLTDLLCDVLGIK